ncbi:type II toxin-antitoxin system RelE/ParE family toxin [Alterisphingorhabdus coralli]|uniref:Type II toxin-antitoxin system RelE/ParE family toxin n=1 Tax=Alterisphingorhabdus coralli TaxID=3071408 RepID=A0AA97I0M3_9SPHN|nr:type II toxin-antitoxin system RelE/ParE family toxin [Parasphingorhabdus sp. SCSIO 66989]WOE75122.1 type II toxin-antitoxin system RelE/ParE family toxin [Parasphingorhabdus sp. SCSIO 66989]
MSYIYDMENEIESTSEFDSWLSALEEADAVAAAKVIGRINRMKLNNFGDCKLLDDGLWEARIDYGPGYRLYYRRTGRTVYLMLDGGTKRTQKRDIKRLKG